MKKSLIALAALAATASFAQSSVSISGNVDMAYQNKEAINTAGKSFLKSSGVGDGMLVPNRFIITVQEDLGGGLKAKFVNEHGISPTSTDDWGIRQNNGAPQAAGAAALTPTIAAATATGGTILSQIPGAGWSTGSTNRGTYLSLGGGFGEVRAGYLVSSFYNASSQSGYLLGGEQYGALLHTLGLGEMGGARANGIQYISPVWSGFNIDLQQQSGAEREATSQEGQAYTVNKAPRTAIRLNYGNGPLAVTYVNTSYKPMNTTQTTAAAAGVVTNTADASNKSDQLLASYTMGDFKFTGSYNKVKIVDNTVSALQADRDMKSMTWGAQYTTGPWTAYYVGGKGSVDGNATNTLTGGVYVPSASTRLNDIKQQQFGVKYAFSKRTTAYAVVGESKDTGAGLAAQASPVAGAAGAAITASNIAKGKVSGFGLTHAF